MRESQAIDFSDHLYENIERYFADFDQTAVHIQLINEQKRAGSTLYRFRISDGVSHRAILIKISKLHNETQSQTNMGIDRLLGERPRLMPVSDQESKLWVEYKALSEIHDYFDRLGDPRFGTIRTLDFLPEDRAIVMEESQDSNLCQLFLKVNRLSRPFTKVNLGTVFYNAGAWLRIYQALPIRNLATVRNAQRVEFLESISDFTVYLGNVLKAKSFFDKSGLKVREIAGEILPETLSLGLGHGDFAMRNILVGPNHRITVLDPVARWQVPIYEDIAYFLIRFEMNRLHILSQGQAFNPGLLTKYKQDFLSGYFKLETIPYKIIQLFEVQALLDNWSSQVLHIERQIAVGHGMVGKLKFILMNRFFRRKLESLLRDVEFK